MDRNSVLEAMGNGNIMDDDHALYYTKEMTKTKLAVRLRRTDSRLWKSYWLLKRNLKLSGKSHHLFENWLHLLFIYFSMYIF